MSDLGRWFRDTPESRRLLAEEIALLDDEPPMPSPCCGRGGFLHHIEDDE